MTWPGLNTGRGRPEHVMTNQTNTPGLHDKVAKGSLFLLFNRLAIKSMDVVILMVLTRLLMPADFGRVAIALSTIQIIETVLDLQTGIALLQINPITRAHLDTAFTIALLRGLAIMVLMVLASVPLARFYRDDHLVALICALSVVPLLRSARSPRMFHFFKTLRFGPEATADLVGKIAALVLSVSIGVITHSYWAIAAGAIAAPLFTSLFSYALCPYWPGFTLQHRPLFYRYMGWGLAGQLCSALNWQTDRFVLGKMVTDEALGLFTTARDFAGTAFKIVMDTLMRPVLAGLSATNGEPERMIRAYGKVLSATMAIALPVGLGQALLAPEIVAVLLGPRWGAAAPIFALVSLAMILAFFSSVTSNLFYAMGRPDLVFQRNFLDLLFRFPATILGIAMMGLQGAVYALIAAEVLLAVICQLSVRRLLGLSLPWVIARIWRSLVSGAAMALVLWLALPLFPHAPGVLPALLTMLALVPLGAATYGGVHLIAWALNGNPEGIEGQAITFVTQRLTRSRTPASI
ncbi:oligosaccharide flippase family protein [Novosphingobium terrae]|uniref:oligosaccharide flippase family protein n=1 Tax=Novosphingobium terrae TaxID=2726189 RepID=UPI00197F9E26|nr:oligosaccharide flippase family protein [Novosphingobium terrae]